MTHWLGLDIGGANLKAANLHGQARTVSFALWKEPTRLAERLTELLATFPGDGLAVTMTGELCDCFPSRRQGVELILDAVEQVARGRPVRPWSTQARFVDLAHARRQPLEVAAANWLALACCAAQLVQPEAGLLLDIGSTTTDIIPFHAGTPTPRGLTDLARLRAGELVYTGAHRTPLCALLGLSAAAEWFATTLDVGLILDLVPEDIRCLDTADGRPATRQAAHGRLAHMLLADAETCTPDETRRLAEQALDVQTTHLAAAIDKVAQSLPESPRHVILSGSGEWLGRRVLSKARSLVRSRVVPLAERWGPDLSAAACAYAVANLAAAEPYL